MQSMKTKTKIRSELITRLVIRRCHVASLIRCE